MIEPKRLPEEEWNPLADPRYLEDGELDVETMAHDLVKLRAENERLREALEEIERYITDFRIGSDDNCEEIREIARQALSRVWRARSRPLTSREMGRAAMSERELWFVRRRDPAGDERWQNECSFTTWQARDEWAECWARYDYIVETRDPGTDWKPYQVEGERKP